MRVSRLIAGFESSSIDQVHKDHYSNHSFLSKKESVGSNPAARIGLARAHGVMVARNHVILFLGYRQVAQGTGL